MLSDERKSEILELCRKMIKVRSYSGEEAELVNLITQVFMSGGYDDYFIDDYGNIVGHIKGEDDGVKLLFDGHMDTVPADNVHAWSHDPFGGEIEDGRIYGRGASDMKGALCAMICAGMFFAKDLRKKFKGDIYVAGVVHEECFEGIGSRSVCSRVKPDYVIIGEASECNLKIGQRGRAEVVVETFGKSAHSSNPRVGINAVNSMVKLISEINKLPSTQDDFLGEGILELTDIKSSPYPGASVVPDYCRATFDRRLLVGESKENVLRPINEIIASLKESDAGFNAKASFSSGEEDCYTGKKIHAERFFPAWKYDEGEEFVQKTLNSLRSSGIDAKIDHYSFCTNGSCYAGEKGIKTLGFGPSKENLAHIVDEYIEIEELYKAVTGYYALMEGFVCAETYK